eukprot:1138957-Pelagomonas_calceolata.AAC.13
MMEGGRKCPGMRNGHQVDGVYSRAAASMFWQEAMWHNLCRTRHQRLAPKLKFRVHTPGVS